MSKPQADGFLRYRGAWIEKGLADHGLSDGAFRVLSCLAFLFLNREKRACWPLQGTLAEALGMQVRTVRNHLKELQQRNHLRVQRRGRDKPNWYIPVVDDRQISATQTGPQAADLGADDRQRPADHNGAMIGKIVQDDRQNSVSMTGKDLPIEPIEEPFDKYSSGDGALRGASRPGTDGGYSGGEGGVDRATVMTPGDGSPFAAQQEDAAPLGPEAHGAVSPDDYGAEESPSAPYDDDDDVFASIPDTIATPTWKTEADVAAFFRQTDPDLVIRTDPDSLRHLLGSTYDALGKAGMNEVLAAHDEGRLTVNLIGKLRRKKLDAAG